MISRPASIIVVCIFLGVSLSFCSKEPVTIQWELIDTDTNVRLNDLSFINPDTGYIAGGTSWYQGVLLSTIDGGKSWQTDTLTSKELMGIHFDSRNKGYATGIDGHLFVKESDENDWYFWRLKWWDVMRDIHLFQSGEGFAVGGISFNNGVIWKFENNYNIIQRDTFPHELSGLHVADPQTIHVVGYGIVLRSTDGGLTWQENGIHGDFFKAVHFPSALVGYAVGDRGSIIKTTDGGDTWKALRKADNVFNAGTSFHAVFFVTNDKGYIAGEKGTLWKTENGGEDWQTVQDLPEVHFNAVVVVKDMGYLIGDEGTVIRFVD